MFCKLCVVLVLIVSFDNTNGVKNKKKLGVMMTSVEPCPNPARKMIKNNPVSVLSSIRVTGNRSSVIDGNINVTRKFGPVFISLRVFQKLDDKLKPIFTVQDSTCRHPITIQLIRAYKAPIDKNCMVEKGVIWVKDLDVDKLSWFLTKAASSPGQYVYETEFTSDNSCVYCSRMISELYVKK